MPLPAMSLASQPPTRTSACVFALDIDWLGRKNKLSEHFQKSAAVFYYLMMDSSVLRGELPVLQTVCGATAVKFLLSRNVYFQNTVFMAQEALAPV